MNSTQTRTSIPQTYIPAHRALLKAVTKKGFIIAGSGTTRVAFIQQDCFVAQKRGSRKRNYAGLRSAATQVYKAWRPHSMPLAPGLRDTMRQASHQINRSIQQVYIKAIHDRLIESALTRIVIELFFV